MKIGITGHQELNDPSWVKREILRVLYLQSLPLIGITSLAVGADQLFAQAVLECGGALQVVVPFAGYVDSFKADGRQEYERLLASAAIIEVLPAISSHEESYFSAGKRVVDVSDLVVAVWNGKPAAGLGGTGDVVNYARYQEKCYIHINPITRKTTQFIEHYTFAPHLSYT